MALRWLIHTRIPARDVSESWDDPRTHDPADPAGRLPPRLFWQGMTPANLLDSLAKFRRQFTMDEQQGSPEVSGNVSWTAASLAGEDAYNVAVGQPHFTTAAVDSRGEVVGFSTIISNVDSPERPVQAGTIVRPEHRGRNLGITLKAANIINVIDSHPQTETITTGVDPAKEHLAGFQRAPRIRAHGPAGRLPPESLG